MASNMNQFREELQKTKRILADPEGTIPLLFFGVVDELLSKILRREIRLSWWANIAIVALFSQIPTLVVSLLLNEVQQWWSYYIGIIWMGYILLGLSAILVARLGVVYLYRNVNKYVVDKIKRTEDLMDLQKILKYVWLREGSGKGVIYFTLAFIVFWSFTFSTVYANFLGVKLIDFGYGLILGTIVFGILTAPALYMEAWFFIFILHMGNYQFQLNETAPVYSEVVQRFSRTTTFMLYSFALFIAFATFAVSLDPVSGDFNVQAVSLVILIGWAPTIIYFVGSQASINRIVTSAKWNTLNRIQEDIRKLNNGDITNKENVDAINRLMDYHAKILTTPNSTLSVGIGLSFANQLALPIFGLLLANLDKIRSFFFPGTP